MVIEMDEREIVKRHNERNRIHVANRDFWRHKFTQEIINKYRLNNYGNRRVTDEMIDDDEFWIQFKLSNTYRDLKKQAGYQFVHYLIRRRAYDVVRKDALGITESNSSI